MEPKRSGWGEKKDSIPWFGRETNIWKKKTGPYLSLVSLGEIRKDTPASPTQRKSRKMLHRTRKRNPSTLLQRGNGGGPHQCFQRRNRIVRLMKGKRKKGECAVNKGKKKKTPPTFFGKGKHPVNAILTKRKKTKWDVPTEGGDDKSLEIAKMMGGGSLPRLKKGQNPFCKQKKGPRKKGGGFSSRRVHEKRTVGGNR